MAVPKTKFVVDPVQPTVVMTRVFDAPRHLVFDAKTKPELLKRWYGPHGHTVVSCESDLRVGGAYRIVGRSPDGHIYAFRGVCRIFDRPSRLQATWLFEGMPDSEAVITDVFEEHGGKTTVTTTTVFKSIADRDGYVASGAEKGAAESLERLDEVLGSVRDVVVTREFAAPRKLVFDAWTKPELMQQWFGPRGFTLKVFAMDFRVGGAYRSCFQGPGGEEYPFGGVYREIVAPERLVYTTTFPDGAEMLTTLTLTEHGGHTQLTVRQAIPDSIPADDPRLRGAPQGWRETIDRLGEFVAKA